MKIINKIDLGKEFQRIIDSGCKHSIVYSDYEQTIILQKFYVNSNLFDSNKKVYMTSLQERIDEYKLFISLLEDFHIVSTMLMSDPVDGLKYTLIETGMTYKFCVYNDRGDMDQYDYRRSKLKGEIAFSPRLNKFVNS